MKIKHISGEILDTDSLPDTEAMVLEKVEQFRQFCLDNKVPFLMFVDAKGSEITSYLAFWNFANRANNYNQESVDTGEKHKVDLGSLLKVVDNFVYGISGGEVYLAQVPRKTP